MPQDINVSIIIIFLSLRLNRWNRMERKRKEEKSIREENGKIEEKKMCADVQRRQMKEIKCILHFHPFNLQINKNINIKTFEGLRIWMKI